MCNNSLDGNIFSLFIKTCKCPCELAQVIFVELSKLMQWIYVSGTILICTLIQAFWEILFSIWDSSSPSSPSSLTELALFDSCGLTTASRAAIFASKAVLSSSRLWYGKDKDMTTDGSFFLLLSSYSMIRWNWNKVNFYISALKPRPKLPNRSKWP